MFLKNLKIHNEGKLIREIPFHKGINLIVDETKSGVKTESGNSVGKTTVLRLIDYCLDGDGKNIYTDSEFKNVNKKIESFLKENNILITLTLVDSLDDPAPKELVIQRNFLTYSNKIQNINGKKKSNEEFSKCLKNIIFKTDSKNPTFKQLKSKNIRDEKNKLVNSLKVLDGFTTDAVYEALHLFWFGIDIDLSKDKLILERNSETKLQTRLRKEGNLSQIKQSLIIINKEIAKLDNERNNFNLNENYELDIQSLNDVKLKINSISNRISHLEMRLELINESKNNLEQNKANIDVGKIKELYNKAKALIPNLQKTFEETLAFHNEMISQKLKFITDDLPQLQVELSKANNELRALRLKERKLTQELSQSKSVKELESIILNLNKFYEKKGRLEEQESLWNRTQSNLDDIDKKLSAIDNEIDAKDSLIQKRIEEFNSYFSDISSRLDGEHSLLSADKDNNKNIYKFEIGNIDGNPGTGGKKSQMAAFDLSYIKFADEKNIPCLHFILQDQIENVHSNQISNLLTEVVTEINCQYVLPVLRDKLPPEIGVDTMEILSLSENDKLFKVD